MKLILVVAIGLFLAHKTPELSNVIWWGLMIAGLIWLFQRFLALRVDFASGKLRIGVRKGS